jgi:hypothetical protein
MIIKFFLVGFFCVATNDCIRVSGALGFDSYEECVRYANAVRQNVLDYTKGKAVELELNCIDAYELPGINFI